MRVAIAFHDLHQLLSAEAVGCIVWARMDATRTAIDATAEVTGGRLLLNYRNLTPLALLINLASLAGPRIGFKFREPVHIDVPIRAILRT